MIYIERNAIFIGGFACQFKRIYVNLLWLPGNFAGLYHVKDLGPPNSTHSLRGDVKMKVVVLGGAQHKWVVGVGAGQQLLVKEDHLCKNTIKLLNSCVLKL